jgi:hypothetical protein
LVPGNVCLIRTIAILYLSSAAAPLLAQSPVDGKANTAQRAPIITDTEFNAAIPSLDDAPLESIEVWNTEQENREADGSVAEPAAQGAVDPLLDDPLPLIENFDAEPPPAPTQAAEREAGAVRYILRLDGLDATRTTDLAKDADGIAVEAAAWNDVRSRFYDLSSLKDNGGRADSRAARAGASSVRSRRALAGGAGA